MFNTARLSDLCTHGAKIIEGSSKHSANGLPVARLGDKVLCPLHADPENKIIEVTGGMPFTDGLLRAHGTAKAKCGAEIIVDMSSSGGSAAEEMSTEMEDMTDDEKRAYLSEKFGGGSGGAAAADSYMRGQGAGVAEDVTVNDPNAASKQVGCQNITNGTPDSFKISKHYTVGDLSSQVYQAALRHAIPSPTGLGMSRADVICNLRHLAVNSIDRCRDYLHSKGYTMQPGSGFRNASNGSDHNRGSAVDMHIFKNGARVSDFSTITALAKNMIESGIPYTQVIAETSGGGHWIHWANRKNGVKSAKPFFVLRV